MAQGGKDREDREARERARLYQARQEFYRSRVRRRRRDDLLVGIVAAVVVLGAVGAQVAYFTAGPGVPVPAPTTTDAPLPTDGATIPGDDPAATPAPVAPEPQTTP